MSSVDYAGATQALLAARRTRHWLTVLPAGSQPLDAADAYAIQEQVAHALGPIAAFKVGAATPQAEPLRAPINQATLFVEPGHVEAKLFNVIGVEAELAYRFDRDLPERAADYTQADVAAAIGAIHPAIEIADTRFTALGVADLLSQRADQQNHGALIIGPALTAWRDVRPIEQPVRVSLNGQVVHEGVGGNSAGDPMRMLVWMANHGARAFGGLRAGQYVTTGSVCGVHMAEPGVRIEVAFPGVGTLTCSIAG